MSALRAQVVFTLLLLLGACNSERSASDEPSAQTVKSQAASSAEHQRVLFIGNSYTAQNNLAAVYTSLAGSLERDKAVEAIAVVPGGYHLAQHAIDTKQHGSLLDRWLVSGSEAERAWYAIVLQDQSQVPGFPERDAERVANEAGAVELAARASKLGAKTVLYMTWGYRDGDRRNAFYPDYPTMQRLIESGYRAYAKAIRAAGHDVIVAPVGLAFTRVYEEGPSAKVQFAALYEPDGSHPSILGTYLAASVLLATIEGVDTAAMKHDSGPVADAEAKYLRRVAHEIVITERARSTLPIQ